jgi:DNA-binding PadR family transcriptional regulator
VEFAILGLLHESALHGYELKKRLDTVLGRFRAFSYGSLYPCLAKMERAGWIVKETQGSSAMAGRRSRVVYKLTADGKEHFQELLTEAGPSTWEDENFGVHFAFFAHTDSQTRLRILEGRRIRLEEKQEGLHAAFARMREKLDDYTLELQRHGLESVEREVRWLNELIQGERTGAGPSHVDVTATRRPQEPSEQNDGQTGTTRRQTPAAATKKSSRTGTPVRGTSK